MSEPTKQPLHPAQTGTVREIRAPRNGKICAPCMIRGARAAKRGPSRQDLRAVYPPTAICGAFRMHGAHILPKEARFRMHGARILPRSPLFPVRGPFWDTWSEKIATDCRPGTYRDEILPRQSARERIAREPCHRRTPGERISRAFCHRRVPGNALGHNLAIARHPETHQ